MKLFTNKKSVRLSAIGIAFMAFIALAFIAPQKLESILGVSLEQTEPIPPKSATAFDESPLSAIYNSLEQSSNNKQKLSNKNKVLPVTFNHRNVGHELSSMIGQARTSRETLTTLATTLTEARNQLFTHNQNHPAVKQTTQLLTRINAIRSILDRVTDSESTFRTLLTKCQEGEQNQCLRIRQESAKIAEVQLASKGYSQQAETLNLQILQYIQQEHASYNQPSQPSRSPFQRFSNDFVR